MSCFQTCWHVRHTQWDIVGNVFIRRFNVTFLRCWMFYEPTSVLTASIHNRPARCPRLDIDSPVSESFCHQNGLSAKRPGSPLWHRTLVDLHCSNRNNDISILEIPYTFCGTWYMPHSQVHNDRTVPVKKNRRFGHWIRATYCKLLVCVRDTAIFPLPM